MNKWKYKEITVDLSFEKKRQNGTVLEHRHVAANILQRPLSRKEVVHHIDEDRTNNSPDNLMIFVSNSDHIRFHKTGVAVKNPDGTFYAPLLEGSADINKSCKDCGCKVAVYSIRCKSCKALNSRKVKRPSKEEILELLNKNSREAVGRMFGVSGNAIRKWLR